MLKSARISKRSERKLLRSLHIFAVRFFVLVNFSDREYKESIDDILYDDFSFGASPGMGGIEAFKSGDVFGEKVAEQRVLVFALGLHISGSFRRGSEKMFFDCNYYTL